ncbi:hypothetical protein [Parasphingorhabdus sp.]|uniref:hypothetical protein n=1 Tax=Parasphingorhabdus sp. TaxID=2709688 RepID=UPI003A9197C0
MFDDLPKSKFDIVDAEGKIRSQVDAIATGKKIIVPDETVIIQTGDEMRRRLPNGTDETFEVVDPVYFQKTFGLPGHFQVEVRKKGMFPHGTGGNYTISVTGTNSRVNIASSDLSTNVAIDKSVFSHIRETLKNKVDDETERAALLAALQRVEAAGDENELGSAYQTFIAAAANHMTVIAPFLPALGQMFGR